MKRAAPWVLGLVAWFACGAAAQDLTPADFLWRGTLEVPAGASLVRVPVPAEALMRLQTPAAHDLRVFDAQAQRVPFAFNAPTPPGEAERRATPAAQALPLHTAQGTARGPQGSTQVRIAAQGQQASVWVQLAPPAPARQAAADAHRASRLPSALFDTRAWKQPVTGFVLQATLPSNVPVGVTAAISTDLASWTPVPLRGRVYRFDGEAGPANDTLDLRQPLNLEGHYLRLDWTGHDGVEVQTLSGLVNGQAPRPARPSAPLPTPRADGGTALEWHLGFATPIAELALTTDRPNTLVPVRVLGRNQPSEPWRLLGQAVVYRLGTGDQESSNPPLALRSPSLRWLRVEATHGIRLEAGALSARAVFEPMEVVFVASGAAPYQLALGRAYTPAGALPLSMLAATTPTRIDTLPAARIVQMNSAVPAPPPLWEQWMPSGVDSRAAGLWMVLVLGVLVLGAVAWSLLGQMKRKPGED